MPIAVDICNTLANIDSQLAKKIQGYCNSQYPFPIPAEYFTSPAGFRVFRGAEPFPGTARLIYNLAELFGGLVYVTTRPPETEFVTKRWLAKHGYPESEVIFCRRDEKADVYGALGPHLIIEDDPSVLEKMKERHVPILVPQWPYNGHIRSSKVVPVYWTEVYTEEAAIQWR